MMNKRQYALGRKENGFLVDVQQIAWMYPTAMGKYNKQLQATVSRFRWYPY